MCARAHTHTHTHTSQVKLAEFEFNFRLPFIRPKSTITVNIAQRKMKSIEKINWGAQLIKRHDISCPWSKFFSYASTAPSGLQPPHYWGSTITLRHTTLGGTPLDEWWARRRDLCRKLNAWRAFVTNPEGKKTSTINRPRYILQKEAGRVWTESSGLGKGQEEDSYENGKQPPASENYESFATIRGNACFPKRVLLHEVRQYSHHRKHL